MNKVIKRAVTGFFFLLVMVSGMLLSPFSFGILFTLITALAVYEFSNLVCSKFDIKYNGLLTAMASSYLFLSIMAYRVGYAGLGIVFPYVLFMILLVISQLYLKRPNPMGNWAFIMLSQGFIAIPFSLLNFLAFEKGAPGEATFTPILPFSIFIFIWVSDTFAYCTGMLFGKHRLLERVSPKKSWEGFFGGLAFAIIASYVLSLYFPILTLGQWAGMAVVIAVFGIYGDLTESLMKRQMEIKDSGNILPGHGGILDRFDSALMAIPAGAAYLYLTGILG